MEKKEIEFKDDEIELKAVPFDQWEEESNKAITPRSTVNRVIWANTLNVRSGAGTNHSITGQVFAGNIITFSNIAGTDASGNHWLRIVGSHPRAGGWVRMSYTNPVWSVPFHGHMYVPPIPNITTPLQRVNTGTGNMTLNLRTGPATSNNLIIRIPNRTNVTVTHVTPRGGAPMNRDHDYNWFRVQVPSTATTPAAVGFVSARYIRPR